MDPPAEGMSIMDGLFIDGRRPKSKKEVKDIVAAGEIGRISVESTSLFAKDDDGGSLDAVLARKGKVAFVGPDPYTKRSFYGTVTLKGTGKLVVS